MRALLPRVLAVAALVAPMLPPAAAAQSTTFDLAGPTLTMRVTRGGVTLPAGAVPGIRAGDRLEVRADLPADQSARYVLVVAFLRGATNPPPKDWFFKAETWDKKPSKSGLSITVPEGAEQAIAFMAPETGGGYNALVKAVRGRPGVFVRAAQDLFQASLDRARLETFVNGVARVEEGAPERLVPVSTALAGTLGIKLDADCLTRARSLQASCLTQNRDGMVLQTGGGTTMAEMLGGTTTQFAYSLAATREGGAGLYSPYISLARDFARLFGVFRSASYQYAPALAVGAGDRLRLQLNNPPSFQNPQTVLVAPLPPIGNAAPPPLRAVAKDAMCLAQPGLVLRLDDAPLLFATGFARDLRLRLTLQDGRSTELPVAADAERGGLVVADAAKVGLTGVSEAVLTGRWGFETFTGPRFPVQNGAPSAWQPRPDDAVVVGRDAPLTLQGGASACVEQVALRDRSGATKPVEWKASAPDELTATLPLARARPGELTLLLAQYGQSAPAQLALKGQTEASRLEGFTLYTGDREGRLVGARLDQVAKLEVAGVTFAAGALTRDPAGSDRLALTTTANTETLPQGASDAKVTLKDGRTTTVRATITPPRPRLELVGSNVEVAPAPGRVALTLPAGLLASDATLTFSVRAVGTRFTSDDAIEVATADDTASTKLTVASGKLQSLGGDVAVGSIAPRQALGAAAVGPLRMRLVQGDTLGEWQPLARVVRLPALTKVACGDKDCTITGDALYLIAAVSGSADGSGGVAVPAGYVGTTVTVPRPAGDRLYLKLVDAPEDVVSVPAGKAS
ncbi:hypothetical protein J2Y58_002218 [Sphingomonas sp. BE138]|uniref:hypothetical protein n=1 Tax=Sphingomonas sp. BE138 TaxID=2817845 RepID=UPI0028594141|nr:hypothetical protein [Sphingomonas sp. BE138]MDR6788853.1 hypothetical protein [Sphingomonas sp. BE138]